MANDYFSLQDKKVLIIGGTSGIGLAVGQHFAAAGASVVVTGRHDRHEVQSSACHFIACDVTDESSVIDKPKIGFHKRLGGIFPQKINETSCAEAERRHKMRKP